MSATAAPFGIQPIYHPSGTIRLNNQVDGVLSTYGTAIYTGTPIKRDTNGTLIPTGTGADSAIGVFMGCQFTQTDGRRFVLPYWPAAQTYVAGSMIAQWAPFDATGEYEGQANGSLASTTIGESINLADTSQGSVYTGYSSQSLTATTTGSTAGTFIIVGLSERPGNAWGDAFTIVRVRVSTIQGPVA